MMAIDTQNIRLQFPIKQTLESRYGLRFRGRKCLCPFHDDKTASLALTQGKDGTDRYKCHGCDARGDVVQFVMSKEGCTMPEAVERLTGQKPVTSKPDPRPQVEPQAPKPLAATWEPIPERKHGTWKAGQKVSALSSKDTPLQKLATLLHRYRDRQGQTILITARIEVHGGKQVWPIRYTDGELRWKGFSEDGELVPLYGMDQLEKWPRLPVVVVEGEKCVDVFQPMVEGRYVVVSWQGGGNRALHADWGQLKDRTVILWPDFDHLKKDPETGEPKEKERGGQKTMEQAAGLLKGVAASIAIVDLSELTEETHKHGYDVADMLETMPAPQVVEWMKARAVDTEPKPVAKPSGPWLPPECPPVMTGGERPGVKKDDPTNLLYLLKYNPQFQNRVTYDVFDQLVLVDNEPLDGMRLREFRAEITASKWPLQPKIKDLQDTIVAMGLRNRTNRFARQLLGLVWDGKKRLQAESLTFAAETGSRGLLVDYANCEDTPFNRVIGMRWLVGAVQRIIQDPNSTKGWQHDSILVLEGVQGFRKTSFLRTLGEVFGREAYTELQGSLGRDKDDLMKLRGKCIVELAEMTAHRKSDQDAFKAFIDKKVDEYRPPYGSEIIKQPRMVVFAGTTNRETYLNDPTGARRFWPATVTAEIDTHKLREDLEQVWAEAVALAQAGEPNHLQGTELEWHAEAVESRDQLEAWEAIFTTSLANNAPLRKAEGLTTQEAFGLVNIIDPKDMTPGATRRLEDMLTRMGYRYRQGNPKSPGQTARRLWRLTRDYNKKTKLEPRR